MIDPNVIAAFEERIDTALAAGDTAEAETAVADRAAYRIANGPTRPGDES